MTSSDSGSLGKRRTGAGWRASSWTGKNCGSAARAGWWAPARPRSHVSGLCDPPSVQQGCPEDSVLSRNFPVCRRIRWFWAGIWWTGPPLCYIPVWTVWVRLGWWRECSWGRSFCTPARFHTCSPSSARGSLYGQSFRTAPETVLSAGFAWLDRL